MIFIVFTIFRMLKNAQEPSRILQSLLRNMSVAALFWFLVLLWERQSVVLQINASCVDVVDVIDRAKHS